MDIRTIKYGSAEYDLEIALRDRILRQPLGLTFDPAALAAETTAIHLGAFINDELVGCLLLVDVGNGVMKMRQVAVDQKMRRQRVGEALVRASEERARAEGFTLMELAARDTAMGFYLRLGYEIDGEPFVEVTISHRKMIKRLI